MFVACPVERLAVGAVRLARQEVDTIDSTFHTASLMVFMASGTRIFASKSAFRSWCEVGDKGSPGERGAASADPKSASGT